MTISEHFTVAAFALDGQLLGTGEKVFDDLSSHWIGVCSELIAHYGPVFDAPLQGPLGHLRIKCTSDRGGALTVIYANEKPVVSSAIAKGLSPVSEAQMLKMFADSVSSSTKRFHVDSPSAFTAIGELTARPILVVVPWPSQEASEQDHDLGKELSLHFAAAFIRSAT